jgi:hypothetical protein
MTRTPPERRRARNPGGPRRTRTIARVVHVVAALALGTFVYAPAEYVEPARLALQVAVVPVATITGVLMWKQAAVRRLLSRRPATAR